MEANEATAKLQALQCGEMALDKLLGQGNEGTAAAVDEISHLPCHQ